METLTSSTKAVPTPGVRGPFASKLLRASVYLSDFGAERLRLEAERGPPVKEYLAASYASAAAENLEDPTTKDEGEDGDITAEAIRKYQVDRARYYYGVLEFADPEAAGTVYDEIDNVDMDMFVDGINLQIIPDDMQFSREPTSTSTSLPKEREEPVARESALRHTKGGFTWDAEKPQRIKVLRRRCTAEELEEMELDEFVAASSSGNSDADKSGDDWEMPDSWTQLPEAICQREGIEYAARGAAAVEDESSARGVLLSAFESGSKEFHGGVSPASDGDESDVELDSNTIWPAPRGRGGAARHEMEIHFDPNLDSLATEVNLKARKLKQKVTSGKTIPEMEKASQETAPGPWQQYLDKKREKKKQRLADRRIEAEKAAAERTELESNVESQQKAHAAKFPLIKVTSSGKRPVVPASEGEDELLPAKGTKEFGHAPFRIADDDDEDEMVPDMHVEMSKKKRQKALASQLKHLPRKQARKLRKAAEKHDEPRIAVDLDDPRFVKLLTDPQFGIDPTAPAASRAHS